MMSALYKYTWGKYKERRQFLQLNSNVTIRMNALRLPMSKFRLEVI